MAGVHDDGGVCGRSWQVMPEVKKPPAGRFERSLLVEPYPPAPIATKNKAEMNTFHFQKKIKNNRTLFQVV